MAAKRSRSEYAQGMVEFALILPILLLVVYGMLEVGRLIFMYTIVANASRDAVRYGSATGLNISGTTERYRDCAGILDAAQNADVLDFIEDTDIAIQFDHGPGTGAFSGCPPGMVINGDRIQVVVTAYFTPIVPIVPLDPITVTSTSARTILVNIPVAGSALPPPTIAPPPPPNTPTATSPATPTETVVPTETFTATPSFTPTSTNDNTATATGSSSIIDTATATVPPTNTHTATATALPTKTYTPTSSYTPSPTLTPTATNVNCYKVTHGAITTPGNTMLMPINNGTGAQLMVTQIYVQWNHDYGHASGPDYTLRLQSISLDGLVIWTGNAPGPSLTLAYVPGAGVILPTGFSDIVFTFHQSYDINEATDRITMQFANNGCGSYTLDSDNVTPTPSP